MHIRSFVITLPPPFLILFLFFSSDIADTSGLESALWVLVHMGSRVAHAMKLAVDAANVRFESSTTNRQSELLR
jgi:hypothetical protein